MKITYTSMFLLVLLAAACEKQAASGSSAEGDKVTNTVAVTDNVQGTALTLTVTGMT